MLYLWCFLTEHVGFTGKKASGMRTNCMQALYSSQTAWTVALFPLLNGQLTTLPSCAIIWIRYKLLTSYKLNLWDYKRALAASVSFATGSIWAYISRSQFFMISCTWHAFTGWCLADPPIEKPRIISVANSSPGGTDHSSYRGAALPCTRRCCQRRARRMYWWLVFLLTFTLCCCLSRFVSYHLACRHPPGRLYGRTDRR